MIAAPIPVKNAVIIVATIRYVIARANVLLRVSITCFVLVIGIDKLLVQNPQ
jgi:hypothetical protein